MQHVARGFGGFVAGSLLIVSSAVAQPNNARTFEDPVNDVADTQQPGMDIKAVTVERKSSGKMEVTIDVADTLPKSPKEAVSFIFYFDLDTNNVTGKKCSETMGADLTVTIFKEPKDMQWRSKIDAVSTAAGPEPFQVAKLNSRSKSLEIAFASPALKRVGAFTFYGESMAGGTTTLDRVPDDDVLKW